MIGRALVVAILLVIGGAGYLVYKANPDGSPQLAPTDAGAVETSTFTIDSAVLGRSVPVGLAVPEGASAARRPLVILLHGRGQDEDTFLTPPLLDALGRLGPDGPAIAFPYGDEASYWHDRADGDWGSFVVGEVIPEAAEAAGADPRRVALGGISMGGFGAYSLGIEFPGRFCALAGHSPALWETAGETPAGAFDDAEDFAAHDVIGAARSAAPGLTGQPVWLDAGQQDPFAAADQVLIDALGAAGADLTVRRGPGEHTLEYWNGNWPRYLRFYEEALRDCDPASL